MTKAIRKIEEIEAIVREIGNGAHVNVPKEWLGRTVVVRLKK